MFPGVLEIQVVFPSAKIDSNREILRLMYLKYGN